MLYEICMCTYIKKSNSFRKLIFLSNHLLGFHCPSQTLQTIVKISLKMISGLFFPLKTSVLEPLLSWQPRISLHFLAVCTSCPIYPGSSVFICLFTPCFVISPWHCTQGKKIETLHVCKGLYSIPTLNPMIWLRKNLSSVIWSYYSTAIEHLVLLLSNPMSLWSLILYIRSIFSSKIFSLLTVFWNFIMLCII